MNLESSETENVTRLPPTAGHEHCTQSKQQVSKPCSGGSRVRHYVTVDEEKPEVLFVLTGVCICCQSCCKNSPKRQSTSKENTVEDYFVK